MDREGGVVGLDDGIRHFGRWDDRKGSHHPIRVFFANFANQEGAHTGTGTSTERVCYLETLETVASLGFASNNIQNLVD